MRSCNYLSLFMKQGTIYLLILIVAIRFSAHGQAILQQHPTLTITVDAQFINADVVYVGDIAFNLQDPLFSSRGPIFFYMSILSDQTTDVMFGVDIIAETEDTGEEVEIFTGITHPIRLEANQPRHFSSRDLARGGRLELYSSESIDINNATGAAKKIVDVVRATSRLPDGMYYLFVTAYLPGSTLEPYLPYEEIDRVVRQMRIVNPTRVELLYPMDGDNIVTPFPLFQWRSDTQETLLRVYEMPDRMRSPEEAITGIPHLETRVSNTNQFIYPQSGPGVRVLEPGKQYVWFVEALYTTSANRVEGIISDLHIFSVIDTQKENLFNIIMQELERLLGTDYRHIIDTIEQGDFEFTGHILLDGNPISSEELLKVIQAIRAGEQNAVLHNVSINQR